MRRMSQERKGAGVELILQSVLNLVLAAFAVVTCLVGRSHGRRLEQLERKLRDREQGGRHRASRLDG